jgi:hypothetical protein
MSRIIIVLIVIIIAGCGGGSIALNTGFKDMSYGLPVPDNPQIWRENIEVVDLDMDGLPDLIAPPPRRHRGTPPRIFLNKGNRWQETTAIRMPDHSSAPDFNYGWIEAGPLDTGSYPSLFMNSHASSLFVLKGISPLSWEDSAVGLPASFGGRALDIGDINNDGALDIVATREIYTAGQKHTNVFLHTAEGWKLMEDNLPPDAFGPVIKLADFNNDGLLDISMTLTTLKTVKDYVFLGDGWKNWATVAGLPSGDLVTIDVADMNGDGHDDLLMIYFPPGSRFNKPAIFLGSEKGFRELPTDFSYGEYRAIAAGFIDCDDRLDIVISTPNGIEVYLQKNGSFRHTLSIETPSPPTFLKLRDMNMDGSEDIVAGFDARNKGSIRVFANTTECPDTRIKNISDMKTLKMGSLIKIEYTAHKIENPYLRRDGNLIPLKMQMNEYGRIWLALPFLQEGQYEFVLGNATKKIHLK